MLDLSIYQQELKLGQFSLPGLNPSPDIFLKMNLDRQHSLQ